LLITPACFSPTASPTTPLQLTTTSSYQYETSTLSSTFGTTSLQPTVTTPFTDSPVDNIIHPICSIQNGVTTLIYSTSSSVCIHTPVCEEYSGSTGVYRVCTSCVNFVTQTRVDFKIT
jgi:hypothetical protein